MNSFKKFKVFAAVAVALGSLVVTPSLATAASLTFDDLTEFITISAGQFEGGFSVNGVQIAPPGPAGSVFGSVTLPETDVPIAFLGIWQDNHLSGNFTRTIYLTEGPGNVISDIFTYTVQEIAGGNRAQISGTFVSADNLGLVPPGTNPGDVFNEDLGPVPFGAAFLGGTISSDPAPEPASIVLLGTGLLACGRAARKRMKK